MRVPSRRTKPYLENASLQEKDFSALALQGGLENPEPAPQRVAEENAAALFLKDIRNMHKYKWLRKNHAKPNFFMARKLG